VAVEGGVAAGVGVAVEAAADEGAARQYNAGAFLLRKT